MFVNYKRFRAQRKNLQRLQEFNHVVSLVGGQVVERLPLNESLAIVVYQELHRIARRYMKNERAGHTLQTTAVVNEVYLRLVDVKNVDWQHRAQFFAISAQMMRRILVDAARTRSSQKRGGGLAKVNVDEASVVSLEPGKALVALDDALQALSKIAPRQAKIVELRYLGGLSEEETAEVLKISTRSVRRDWYFARAWLMRELSGPG